MGWAWCPPGHAREAKGTLRGLPFPYKGLGSCQLPASGASLAAHPLPPTPAGRPHPGKLPGVLPDLLPTFPQIRSQRNKGQPLLEVREWRSPSTLPSRSNRFLLPTRSQG